MSDFITLLATVYICDAMVATMGPLPKDDALRCAVASETLMIGFLTKEERREVRTIALAGGVAGHKGLEKFRAWEHDHMPLVERFKDEARTIVEAMR